MLRKRNALYVSFVAIGGASVAVPLVLAGVRQTLGTEIILPNTSIGPVKVGGTTKEQAAKALRTWWEMEKRKPLPLESAVLTDLPELTASQVGVSLDDEASVAQAPTHLVLGTPPAESTDAEPKVLPVVYLANGQKPVALLNLIKQNNDKVEPAKVFWRDGAVVRQPEGVRLRLEESQLVPRAIAGLESGTPIQLPIEEAEKRVADEQLDQIQEVVMAYSTHFPMNPSRVQNLKVAAGKIDGTVILPGAKFSFNDVVGRRSEKEGFKVAPILVRGQHATGIGGGICQVCSTLYNCVLYADMKILRRINHSVPVAYVPPGRDATVAFGSLDFVWQNTYDTPVAVTSEFKGNRIIFRLLGQKKPGLKVVVYQQPAGTVPLVTTEVEDLTLPVGTRKVIDPGSARRDYFTFRKVYQDGVLVREEKLNRSRYGGQPRIVAVGPKVPPTEVPTNPAVTTSPETTVITP